MYGDRELAAPSRRWPVDTPRCAAASASSLCAGMIVAVLALAGLGTAVMAEPIRSLLEMRRERVVSQFWDLSCGAAALATVLTYQHGDPVSEREVARGLVNREEYLADTDDPILAEMGFSLLDLKRYVEARGYQGIGYGRLSFDELREHAPIIVPVDFFGYSHFVVVRGMRGDRVLLADPAWGNRTMLRGRFEAAWLDYPRLGKVGFVVASRDRSQAPNLLAPRERDFVHVR